MKITLETSGGEFSFECPARERILFAALRSGLGVPYECATGTCGTCRGRLAEGSASVEWEQAPGFARLRRDKGDVLMCQALPLTDCRLRVPANVAAKADGVALPRQRTGSIENLRRLAPDVIDFAVALSEPMTFAAGQFVVLETSGVRGGRAYSMVNFDRNAARLSLVVKQKAGGRFCELLFAGNAAGREVGVFGPLGRATFNPDEGRDVLCIAGGSGIAGMLSILEHATRERYFRRHRGHVFFGVRTLADGFYLEELSHYAAASEGSLAVTLALSEQAIPAATHGQYPLIALAEGMVADAAMRIMAGRYDNVVAFVAGPEPMVDASLRFLIRQARLPAQFVRYDKFS